MSFSLISLVRVCVFPAFLVLPALSIQADANGSSWIARAWQTNDGLPDNSVSGVAQTADGYLWVATDGGLVRFDGVRFEEFSPAVIEGVPNRVVRSLSLDVNGQMWLGMDRGAVAGIRQDAAYVVNTGDGLPDLLMTTITRDREGTIWIAYDNGVIAGIHEDQVSVFGETQGFAGEEPSWVARDIHGQLWFSSGNRIGVIRDDRFQTLLTVDEDLTRICRARSGGIWIGAGSRLLKYGPNGVLDERGRLPTETQRVEPQVLFEDRSGAVWIGTAASGLFRYDGANFERAETSHRNINCLTEDREGNIWVGTEGGGLNRLQPRPLELLDVESGLPFQSIRSVAEDVSHTIWIATQNGLLARREAGRWNTVSLPVDTAEAYAFCVAAAPQGGVWIGTRDHGLLRLREGAMERWDRQDGLASHAIRSLLAASSGELWLGLDSPNQVQRFHGGKFQTLEMPQPPRSIRAMTEDSAGNIWIGTAEGQLLRTSEDRRQLEPMLSMEDPHSIRCLHATGDGSVWIGFAGWGLGRMKNGNFSRLTSAQGLTENYISQLVSDEKGRLWFAGNRGIFQVRLQKLADALEGRAPDVQSIVYGPNEGLPNLQANYDSVPGAMRGSDGRLWIPMRTGLAVIYPENVRENPDPPPVVLEQVLVDNEIQALYDRQSPLRAQAFEGVTELRNPSQAMRLPPDHRNLDFHFTALSLSAPPNVFFRYRLEGYDENWIEVREPRNARYSRLPAGDYRFHVLACNNSGVWNETGAALSFVVTPFFWQTWWFRGLMLTGFTLCVVAIVRYVSFRRLRLQMRHLEEQAALYRERDRIAKDIHDDLGGDLTQIGLLSEFALQDRVDPDKAGRHIEKISVTARHLIKSMDEIVWAVNPHNDTLAHLIDYAGQFAVDYLSMAGVRCRLDFPEQTPDLEVSTEVRHNLFLIVKEALNNIVKHAGAGEAWLRIITEADWLSLEIQDDGCGFDPAVEKSEANGLRNIRQRAAELKGKCRIESQPGAGTRIVITVPLEPL